MSWRFEVVSVSTIMLSSLARISKYFFSILFGFNTPTKINFFLAPFHFFTNGFKSSLTFFAATRIGVLLAVMVKFSVVLYKGSEKGKFI